MEHLNSVDHIQYSFFLGHLILYFLLFKCHHWLRYATCTETKWSRVSPSSSKASFKFQVVKGAPSLHSLALDGVRLLPHLIHSKALLLLILKNSINRTISNTSLLRNKLHSGCLSSVSNLSILKHGIFTRINFEISCISSTCDCI